MILFVNGCTQRVSDVTGCEASLLWTEVNLNCGTADSKQLNISILSCCSLCYIVTTVYRSLGVCREGIWAKRTCKMCYRTVMGNNFCEEKTVRCCGNSSYLTATTAVLWTVNVRLAHTHVGHVLNTGEHLQPYCNPNSMSVRAAACNNICREPY